MRFKTYNSQTYFHLSPRLIPLTDGKSYLEIKKKCLMNRYYIGGINERGKSLLRNVSCSSVLKQSTKNG